MTSTHHRFLEKGKILQKMMLRNLKKIRSSAYVIHQNIIEFNVNKRNQYKIETKK